MQTCSMASRLSPHPGTVRAPLGCWVPQMAATPHPNTSQHHHPPQACLCCSLASLGMKSPSLAFTALFPGLLLSAHNSLSATHPKRSSTKQDGGTDIFLPPLSLPPFCFPGAHT